VSSIDFLNEYLKTSDLDSTNEFSRDVPSQYEDIAMSRGTARQIIDRFTKEAINKNITPDALLEGFSYLEEVGQSPDYTRRTIRNTLKSPIGEIILENPKMIGQAVDQFDGLVKGVNPELAGKHMGLVNQIMQEAKKDNLFRSNVTLNEIRDEIQRPVYGALMDWTKSNLNNAKLQKILEKSSIGQNAETYGLRGLIPTVAGFEPKQFGVKLTPAAQREEDEYYKQRAQEQSPMGQKERQQNKIDIINFRKSLDKLKNAVR
jgi:hypothetical protein